MNAPAASAARTAAVAVAMDRVKAIERGQGVTRPALDAILARNSDRDVRFTARHERDRRQAAPAPAPQAMLL